MSRTRHAFQLLFLEAVIAGSFLPLGPLLVVAGGLSSPRFLCSRLFKQGKWLDRTSRVRARSRRIVSDDRVYFVDEQKLELVQLVDILVVNTLDFENEINFLQ